MNQGPGQDTTAPPTHNQAPSNKNAGPGKGREKDRQKDRRKHQNRRAPGVTRAAVIDLGTNNCRLLIAEKINRPQSHPQSHTRRAASFRIIDSFSRIVRLGEGLSQTGQLGPEAMERTLAALKVCAHKIAQSGVDEVQAVATEACRRATNGPDFLIRVQAQTGIELKTISPLQEVQLGVSSTLPLLSRRFAHGLIFDVGGGSTEVSFLTFKPGKGFTVQGSLSVPLGVVNLAEDYSTRGADLSHTAYQTMVGLVVQAFRDFATQHKIPERQNKRQVQTVGMSGTVTTVKAIELGLKTYRRASVDRTLFYMAGLPAIRDGLMDGGHKGLLSHGCIGQDRADLVLPGIAILEGLAKAFGFDRLLVLDRGLREGLLHNIFKRQSAWRPKKKKKSGT